jgi:transposase
MEEIAQGGDINISDIPDIELYMDQVTTFIDNKLGYHKRTLKDKILTKTMINNYTKSKILLPSKNKKYNRQHMILLILIYYLKQILSINDINILFEPLFENMASSKNGLDYLGSLYNSFLQVKDNSAEDLKVIMSQKLKFINDKAEEFSTESKETSRILLTVLMLVATASIQKRIAEKIIDDYLHKK